MHKKQIISEILEKLLSPIFPESLYSRVATYNTGVNITMTTRNANAINTCILEGASNLVSKILNVSALLSKLKESYGRIQSKESFNTWYLKNQDDRFEVLIQASMDKLGFSNLDIYSFITSNMFELEDLINTYIYDLTVAISFINSSNNANLSSAYEVKQAMNKYLTLLDADLEQSIFCSEIPNKTDEINIYHLANIFKKGNNEGEIQEVLKVCGSHEALIGLVLYLQVKRYLESTSEVLAYRSKKEKNYEEEEIYEAIDEYIYTVIAEDDEMEEILSDFDS